MPKLISRNPKYRKHKCSGQAIVTIEGRDIYLGPYGTSASKREYDRIIGEWLTDKTSEGDRPLAVCPWNPADVTVGSGNLAHADARMGRTWRAVRGST